MTPLYEKRGSNPSRLVGYQDEAGGLWTANMRPSEPARIIEGNRGFQGRVVRNKAHRARVAAARAQRPLRKFLKRSGRAA